MDLVRKDLRLVLGALGIKPTDSTNAQSTDSNKDPAEACNNVGTGKNEKDGVVSKIAEERSSLEPLLNGFSSSQKLDLHAEVSGLRPPFIVWAKQVQYQFLMPPVSLSA